jgi:hypothetical protein
VGEEIIRFSRQSRGWFRGRLRVGHQELGRKTIQLLKAGQSDDVFFIGLCEGGGRRL